MSRMEHRKGCPACEHTDPQLERELEALATLLFEAYLENCGVSINGPTADEIDNTKGRGTLKEVDANP